MLGLKKRGDETRADEQKNVNAKRLTLTLVLAVVLPILILWAVNVRQFRQLTDIDSIDYAQVARNIQAGRGFITSVVRPLATTHSNEVLKMPDMVHPPLFAYAEALVLATGPASDTKAFVVAGLFFLLTIPVLYTLAKAMFNPKVAQLAIFAYTTSLFMTNMILTGGPATMVGFIFTLTCLVLYRYAQEASPENGVPQSRGIIIRAAICGAMFALCYLTDYMLIFAFLPIAIFMYVAGKRNRMLGLASFVAAFLVVAGYWMIRNTTLTGNPLFGMRAMEIGMGTTVHPGLSLYRTTVPQSVLGLLQETKGELGKKLLQGVQVGYGTLPVLGQPYLVAFFIVGLFYSFRRTGVNAVRGMILAAILCVAVFGNLFIFQLSSLTAFAPVMLAFAAAYFVRLLTDAKLPDFYSKCVSTLAVVLLSVPLALALANQNPNRPQPHTVENDVGRRVKTSYPILTDRAFEMAWYGSRTTIWLPDTEKDVENLGKITYDRQDEVTKKPAKVSALQAIYLSAALNPNLRSTEDYDIWRGMYASIATQALRGQFARMDEGSLKGFALFRDMDGEAAQQYMQNGALLLMKDGVSRVQ